jgi:hypothetical protein
MPPCANAGATLCVVPVLHGLRLRRDTWRSDTSSCANLAFSYGSPLRLHVRVFPAGLSWYDQGWGQDAHELAAELEHDDREVVLELPDPRYCYSVDPTWENLAIFIAGGVSTNLLPLVVADLYEGTKRFVRKRFAKKENTSAGHDLRTR